MVLSPEWPWTRPLLGLALVALIVVLVLRAISRDRNEYQRFKRFERTRNRQRMMRRWLISSLLTFGGSGLLLLLLAGQFVPALLTAAREWPVGVWFTGAVTATGAVIPGVAIGVAVALVAGTILLVFRLRNTDDVPTIGDIGAILPRNRAELKWGAALSVNAGVVEELLFRAAVPAALFGFTGSSVAAVVGSILLFGALHLYQGAAGMIGATVIGTLLMVIYLATGSILIAMIAHALIDLRSLVLIPVALYRVQTIR